MHCMCFPHFITAPLDNGTAVVVYGEQRLRITLLGIVREGALIRFWEQGGPAYCMYAKPHSTNDAVSTLFVNENKAGEIDASAGSNDRRSG